MVNLEVFAAIFQHDTCHCSPLVPCILVLCFRPEASIEHWDHVALQYRKGTIIACLILQIVQRLALPEREFQNKISSILRDSTVNGGMLIDAYDAGNRQLSS